MKALRLSIGLALLGLLVLSALAIAGMWRWLTTPHIRELPAEAIGRTFEMVARHPLPQYVDEIRAVFWDSRDPAIFVKFRTNPQGIAYMIQTFGEPGTDYELLSPDDLTSLVMSGWEPFFPLSLAQEQLGISLFNVHSLRSVHVLERNENFEQGVCAYTVIIDDESSTVYMYVLRVLTRGGR